MKKIKYLVLLIILLFSFVACYKVSFDDASPDTLLMSVLKSEITFESEDGKMMYLKDFLYGSDESTDYYAKPQEYTFVDFDSDGINELVVNISPNNIYYMVFYINNDNINGYLIGGRSLQCIKEDGSFIQTGGAGINYYCKMEFANDSYKIINSAVKDETAEVYKINGKESTIGAVNKYIEDWYLKNDTEWIKIS